MSVELDEKGMMGMPAWHLHGAHGLVLCAGNNSTCYARDGVAEPSKCETCGGGVREGEPPCSICGGGTLEHLKAQARVDYLRFERITECVNALARVPKPDGLVRAIEVLWVMAEDEEHEGSEDARDALFEMGFFGDEEATAEALRGKSHLA